MKKVIGLGNALVDLLMMVDDEFIESLSFRKGTMNHIDLETARNILHRSRHIKKTRVTGGSVANAINGLSRLGVGTGYIGKIGDDEFGDFFQKEMKENGIVPFLFKGVNGTGTAICMIAGDSERTFATYLGAAIELTAADLSVDLFQGYDYFFLEGYMVQNHDLVERSLELASGAGLMNAIDLSSYNIVEENNDFLHEMVDRHVDIVFANEDEARVFTGRDIPEQAVKILSESCDIAIVKTGAQGSLIIDSDGNLHRIDPFSASPVDTTGAGDFYASGFFYGLSENLPVEKCGRIGSLLASKVVEVIGADIPEKIWDSVREGIRGIL